MSAARICPALALVAISTPQSKVSPTSAGSEQAMNSASYQESQSSWPTPHSSVPQMLSQAQSQNSSLSRSAAGMWI
ncbi:hypothetical protein [Cryptosporangium minutisporangium]|uniref:hypothetical protein n=1 Tax=Cryptosporangium minutisporangium TaxID=113569 RepID=UPI0031F08EC8